MSSSQFSTVSLPCYCSEYLKQTCQKVYYYFKILFGKWLVSLKSNSYFTKTKSKVNLNNPEYPTRIPRVNLFNYHRRLRTSHSNAKMDTSDTKEENSQKEVGFITPFQNLSLNQSLQDSTYENALSSSQLIIHSLTEESTHEKGAESPSLLTSGKINTFTSSSTHSIPSLVNSGNTMLPFDHIWIAQLCTWFHARGLQHYGATFPDLFTNEVFHCPRSKFVQECGHIDGPHIYDAVQLLYWLHRNSFGHLWHQLSGFSFQDITSFSKKDLTSICGRNDGLRLYYALKVKLTIYCALENNDNERYVWKVISLRKLTVEELIKQLTTKFNLPQNQIQSTKLIETLGIDIVLDDDLLSRFKHGTEYVIQLAPVCKSGFSELRFKPYCG